MRFMNPNPCHIWDSIQKENLIKKFIFFFFQKEMDIVPYQVSNDTSNELALTHGKQPILQVCRLNH